MLKPLWERVGGRDALAALSGISPTQLSGYNSGNVRLGRGNAIRIVAVVPGATLDELGIPPANADVSLQGISDEIREINQILLSRASWLARVDAQLAAQTALLATLSKLAAALEEATSTLLGVAERLDSATTELPRRRQPRRSA